MTQTTRPAPAPRPQRKNIEAVAVLDMSGSMGSVAQQTIAGFNAYLDELKKLPHNIFVTLVLFDDRYIRQYVSQPAAKCPPLTSAEYVPRGGTALRDALCQTVADVWEAVRTKPHRTDRVSIFLSTDGQENASQKIRTDAEAKGAVELMIKNNHWEFLFAGANMDARAAGTALGFHPSRIVNIAGDGLAQQHLFKALARTYQHHARGEAVQSFQLIYQMVQQNK